MIFEALKSLFAGAEEIIVNTQGGMWNEVPIRRKPSADRVCTKYHAARAALAEEAERKQTAQQQREEETWRERQAAEEKRQGTQATPGSGGSECKATARSGGAKKGEGECFAGLMGSSGPNTSFIFSSSYLSIVTTAATTIITRDYSTQSMSVCHRSWMRSR
ncbi:hypothetical protein EDD16DRAFT_507049 [Pisolithus croceorrhizus]|nr:hypothetical protein EDD16DRAFT_507049 [Pisolithus croceorrhizus]KAI6103858.1 hypothetical protein EV401DRAFT_690026 [Pisolithus croceorrhizus]